MWWQHENVKNQILGDCIYRHINCNVCAHSYHVASNTKVELIWEQAMSLILSEVSSDIDQIFNYQILLRPWSKEFLIIEEKAIFYIKNWLFIANLAERVELFDNIQSFLSKLKWELCLTCYITCFQKWRIHYSYQWL